MKQGRQPLEPTDTLDLTDRLRAQIEAGDFRQLNDTDWDELVRSFTPRSERT